MNQSKQSTMQKYYPWLVVLGCAMWVSGSIGFLTIVAGNFYVPICEDLGFAESDLGFYMTLVCIGQAISFPIAGRLIPKMNIPVHMTIICAIEAVAAVAMSLYGDLYMWYISGAIIGFCMGFNTSIGVAIVLENWFAKKTGFALNHIPFIAVYSSVLKRTIATASHIIGERDIPLFHHQGLNEQYFGTWEGQLVDTLREHPEFQQLIKDPANYKAQVNGGETFEQLGKRAMKALHDIIKIHDKGNILIVSHGHTLRLLLALLNGATWKNHRDEDKSVSLINTSISVVHYDDENGFRVEKMNDANHLK